MGSLERIVSSVAVVALLGAASYGVLGCHKKHAPVFRAVPYSSSYHVPSAAPSITNFRTVSQQEKGPSLLESSNVSPTNGQTDISSHLTDVNGNVHDLTNCFSDTLALNVPYRTTVATFLSGEHVYYLFDLSKVDSYKRGEKYIGELKLTDGKVFSGSLIPNDRTTNFYQDSGNPLLQGHLYGTKDGSIREIPLDKIKEVSFKDLSPDAATENKAVLPKEIVLVDGTIIATNNGSVVDFYGSDWSSHQTQNLADSCLTMSHGSVNLGSIDKVDFTGGFIPKDSQCRGITLHYQNGTVVNDSLSLFSESYGGSLNHSSRYGGFDKFFATQPFGAVLVSLDVIKSVSPLKDAPASQYIKFPSSAETKSGG